MLLDTDYELN